LIDEARKTDPNNAAAFVSEGLLLDRTDKDDQAQTVGSPPRGCYGASTI
jgi:hypothetical protein